MKQSGNGTRLRITCSLVQQRPHQVAKLAIFRCLVICTMALPTSLTAATYYVDFASGADTNNGTAKATPWKRAPGMTGCTNACNSTTLKGGDTVIFKGGVTWTSGAFPWSLPGGSTSYLTFTTDHTWYSGGSWSQPIFDFGGGGFNTSAEGMVNAETNYVALNDLTFQDGGWETNWSATDYSDNVNFHFEDVSHMQVTNCTFLELTWLTFYVIYESSGGDITFSGNDFSQLSNAIWVATLNANTVVTGITITNNTFHDYHNGMVQGTHGNGFHFYSVPSSDNTQYATGIVYCNNRSYGDFTSIGTYVDGVSGGGMTALYFTEHPASGVICNNDFSFSPAAYETMFNSLILPAGGSGHTKIEIYNNSLVDVGAYTNAISAAINTGGFSTGDTIIIKNNIISNPAYCINLQDSGTAAILTSDYNLLNCAQGENYYVSGFDTYAQWKALGYDTHSVLGSNPLWVAAPGNEHLQSTSPARGAGVNLTSLGYTILNSDLAGVARPSSGAWDIGAFQGSAVLSPPSGLKAVVR